MQIAASSVGYILTDVAYITELQNAIRTNSNDWYIQYKCKIEEIKILRIRQIGIYIAIKMLRLPLLQVIAIPRKVLRITTNPKPIQPNKFA